MVIKNIEKHREENERGREENLRGNRQVDDDGRMLTDKEIVYGKILPKWRRCEADGEEYY